VYSRPHHQQIALVLGALDPQVLAAHRCWFGGGTAMALRYGEYRRSDDIDFLVCDLQGYRALRQALGGLAGLSPLTRQGVRLDLAGEVRADQYGIRTRVQAGDRAIKLEIVLEARIALQEPAASDWICGVPALCELDLAAEKLLANADRWPDDAIYSRDLIDLAMQAAPPKLLRAAAAKAEVAYGQSIKDSVGKAVERLRQRPGRLQECMQALAIDALPRAALWNAILRVHRAVASG
jgi:hypothetical protein